MVQFTLSGNFSVSRDYNLNFQNAENLQNWALFVVKQLLRQCCAMIGYTCAVYKGLSAVT